MTGPLTESGTGTILAGAITSGVLGLAALAPPPVAGQMLAGVSLY